jgi:dTMP kinase
MQIQKKGFFCVVEGMDGAGKTTVLRLLADWIQGSSTCNRARSAVEFLRSLRCVFLREPTSTQTGQEIRRRLASHEPTDILDWIQLFRADREVNLKTGVWPALARGDVVIQDRYIYSTAAYQGAFSEMGPKGVLAEFSDFPLPDLLIFLDIDETTAFVRMQMRSPEREYFERPDRWRRIRNAYREVLPDSAVILDASLPVEDVAAQMAEVLAHRVMSHTGKPS